MSYVRFPVMGIGIIQVASVSALPASAADGQIFETLDTNILYIYDAGTSSYVIVGGGGVPLSVGTIDSQPASANGAVIASNQLIMQSADATHPGLVNNTTQSFSGNKTFTGTISASNLSGTNTGDVTLTAVGASPNADGASLSGQALTLQPADNSNPGVITAGLQTIGGNKVFTGAIGANGGIDLSAPGTLSIGTLNPTAINIGNSGTTVNIQGTTLYENVTQLQVTDPLITLNKGGGAGSAANSGIELEENSLITGYVETSADRNSWALKAPNTAGVATITPGAGGITLYQSSHDPVTLTAVGASPNANGASLSGQVLTLQPANTTNPGVLTAADWNTFNGKQAAGNYITALTGDVTASGPGSVAATIANSAVTNAKIANSTIDLTAKVTGVLPLANGGTNKNMTATAGGVVYTDADSMEVTSAGSSGQVLTSNGSSAPSFQDIPAQPSGMVQMFAGSSAPTGWLTCDGSAISRTTFAALFAVIGTTYGAGNGSTTFNIPDCRGIFVRGVGTQTISSISYTGTLGATQGDQLQGHFHSMSNATGLATYQLANVWAANAGSNGGGPVTVSVGAATSDGTNGTPRVGAETRPANISMNYIIKT